MELNSMLLLLKALWPSIKELILGKYTLKEALAENIVASILLVAMILMLFVTVYINDLATGRYKEIISLREEVAELLSAKEDESLNCINVMPDIPDIPTEVEIFYNPTPVTTVQEMAAIPKVKVTNKEKSAPKPVILRKHAIDRLNAVPR